VKFVFLFIILITSSCSDYRRIEADGDRSGTDYFVSTTDSATKAANLPILRNLSLDDDLTEIRIWTGFGPMVVHDMYRVYRSDAGAIKGEVIWYFDPPLDYWDKEEADEFYSETYEYCNKIGVFEGTESCLYKLDKNVDWNTVNNNLNKIDIWNIPDESEVPKYVHKDVIVTLDGSYIIVELKKKGYYRSFGHRLSPAPIKKKYRYGHKIMDVLIEGIK
jgi:hypothetical protein